MSREFNFEPFKANEPILDQLTATRLNAMLDGINRNRVEFGDNITGTRAPGGTIVRAKFNPATAENPTDYSFRFMDATEVVDGEASNKVLVLDGKINGTLPAGMGSDEYVLDLDTPEDSCIYAGATFDPDTLAITSRFLGVSTASAYPESRIDEGGGFLYWLLGFTYFDGDGTFRMRNTLLGDINFELVYGSMNGAPALLPVFAGPGWLDIPA